MQAEVRLFNMDRDHGMLNILYRRPSPTAGLQRSEEEKRQGNSWEVSKAKARPG